MQKQQKLFTKTAVLLIILITSSVIYGQTPKEVFNLYCKSCHTIGGGKLIGPDLKNVFERQQRNWLVKWIMDPMGILNAKDTYALKIQKEANGVIMAPTPGMTESMANALLDLIENESKKEISEFGGNIAEKELPLTEKDATIGKVLFMGYLPFNNDAPACIGCHTVNSNIGILGGGRLGPNLSDAYTRLGEQRGLGAWLSAPPGITMNPIFKDHQLEEMEIHSLVAFLKDESFSGNAPNAMAAGNFIVFGLLFTILVLISFGLIWSTRFRNVRKKMFEQSYSS